MPQVFRPMKRDEDGLPRVNNTATGLGVREPPKDINVDTAGNVEMNGRGMSVRPTFDDIPLEFIPKRLSKEGLGENALRVFRYGEGQFKDGPFAAALNLLQNKPNHGNVVPAALVSLEQFRLDLAATRPGWYDIEN